MKVIVAGSREITDVETVRQCIQDSGLDMTELVHGGCRGVDSIADSLFDGVLPIRIFPADWSSYGKAAGPIRNQGMCEYADALIAIALPGSRGTVDMVKRMKAAGKPVVLFVLEGGRIERVG